MVPIVCLFMQNIVEKCTASFETTIVLSAKKGKIIKYSYQYKLSKLTINHYCR